MLLNDEDNMIFNNTNNINNTNNPENGYKQFINKETSLSFRGIAAVMVILSHYAEWYSWFVQSTGNREVFRVALTKLGVYGVDIFFLLSGYAMVKSLGDKKVNHDFIIKRIRNIYLPYFIVTGVIELISGGFTSLKDFWKFASGYDYWYMNVLFVFYIGFIIIYALFKNTPIRVVAFSALTYIYSHTLYKNGMYEFWYVSNITFVIGIITAELEKLIGNKKIDEDKRHIIKIASVINLIMIIILGIGMFFIVKSGLYGQEALSSYTIEQQIRFKIGATIVWTLLVLLLAAKWKIKEKIFAFLGKNSLYLYLTHTYIFMRVINSKVFENISFNIANTALITKFAISAVITIVVSGLCGFVISGLTKLLSYRHSNPDHS